jgi:hypothetical protein
MGLFKDIARFFTPAEEECPPRTLGRNDDCWCGSGRKYKKCHLEEDYRKLRARQPVSCGKT